MKQWLKKVFLAFVFPALIALTHGCAHLNDNGKSSDDAMAMLCGFLGVICFWAGLKNDGNKPNVTLIVIGIILILA